MLDPPFSRRDSLRLLTSLAGVHSMDTTGVAWRSRRSVKQRRGVEMDHPWADLLETKLGMPGPDTIKKLYDEMDFQRAVLCYLWATPIVGMQGV
jgi:hypothetical protein